MELEQHNYNQFLEEHNLVLSNLVLVTWIKM